jgi:hypothetical protein
VIDEEVERLRPDDITGHRYDLAGTLRLTLDGVISRPDTLRRRETCMRCARRRRVELTETRVYRTELGTIFSVTLTVTCEASEPSSERIHCRRW